MSRNDRANRLEGQKDVLRQQAAEQEGEQRAAPSVVPKAPATARAGTDRRAFLKVAGAGMVGGVAAACSQEGQSESGADVAAPAVRKSVRTLKMVMSWPRNFPGLGTGAERFAKRLEAISDGRYKVRLFAGGELVHPLKCLDAVQQGTADLYHSAEYYYQGKSKAFSFFSAVPFGFRADEMDAWIQHGGGQALWDELAGAFGVKPFVCGNTGSQMGGWFKKPVETVSDFKGLTMRIPGLGGDVIKALGGTPVTLAGSEILTALQSGAIDATEWVGPYNDLAFGLYKLAKHYYFPGFHEPGTVLSLGVSRRLYDRMPASDRAMIEACALAENGHMLAEFNARNALALRQLVDRHGVRLKEFSDGLFKTAAEAGADVVAAAGASDALSKKVYDSYMKFRKLALGWSARSDLPYMRKRALV